MASLQACEKLTVVSPNAAVHNVHPSPLPFTANKYPPTRLNPPFAWTLFSNCNSVPAIGEVELYRNVPALKGALAHVLNTPSASVKLGSWKYPGPMRRRRKFGWRKGSKRDVAETEGRREELLLAFAEVVVTR